MFDGKKILITGGTGSLGQALTKRLLQYKVSNIRIFSRNESDQIDMESKFNDKRLRFLLGDIRDYSRLLMAMESGLYLLSTIPMCQVGWISAMPFITQLLMLLHMVLAEMATDHSVLHRILLLMNSLMDLLLIHRGLFIETRREP